MKRAILFYQHVVREFESCKRLRELLYELDIETIIIQIDFDWYSAVKEIRNGRIDAVIMPWLYDDANYALLSPFFYYNPDLVVINLHHEQISTPSYDILQQPKTEYTKNGTYHIAWGEDYADRLRSYGISKELVFITGNMRTDSLLSDDRVKVSKEILGKKYGLDYSKRWLLYAENRGWIYSFNDTYRKETINRGVSPKDIDLNMHVCSESLELTYNQLKSLDSRFKDEFELIYRIHPGTITPMKYHDGIHIISELPIGDWIGCSDVLMTWNSTSAYEAAIAGIPVIRHLPIDCPELVDIFGMRNFPYVRDFGAITGDYIAEIAQKQSRDKHYEKYYGIVDGHSTERVAIAISKAIDNGMPQRVKLMLNSKQRQLLRKKRLYENVTRRIYKMGLLERIHWPRSAFDHFSDLPYR